MQQRELDRFGFGEPQPHQPLPPPLVHVPHLGRSGLRVGEVEGVLGQGAGLGGAPVVGGVGLEWALGLLGGVVAAQHLVEGVGQLLELVLRPLEVEIGRAHV